MSKNPQHLSISFTEPKKTIARESLKNTAGVFLRTKNGIIFALKAPAVISIELEMKLGRSLYVCGVADSATEARNFMNSFSSFVSSVKDRFSLRDLSLPLVQDFICRLILENLYRQNSERPMPLEVFITQFETGVGLTYAAVDFNGNSRADKNICLIGCTDESRRRLLLKKIKSGRLDKMPLKKLIQAFEKIFARIGGNFHAATFAFSKKGQENSTENVPDDPKE